MQDTVQQVYFTKIHRSSWKLTLLKEGGGGGAQKLSISSSAIHNKEKP